MTRYKSLIDNVLSVSRGSFGTNTHIELQVRSYSTGYFCIDYTDGYKFLSITKIVKLNEVKKLIRAFNALKQ